jgi:protein-L-isoaspartate(D-aspartate) O-methyltransferase
MIGRAPSPGSRIASFAAGRWHEVTRLYRHNELPDERCWLRGTGWCLAYS